MKKPLKWMYTVVAAAALLSGQAASAADAPAAGQQLSWPDVDQAWLEKGTFVNVDNLRQVAPGLTKDQLYDLLGRPHFTTGLFGVREWNYLFNFRTGRGDEYVSCQYKVLFDENYLAQSLHWRDPACASVVAKPQPVAAPAPVPAPVVAAPSAPQRRKFTLEADGLFRFAGGTQADLLPEGQRKVQALTADLLGHAKLIHSLSITGHADRFGSSARNQALSLQRAQTVRDLMVQGGVPAQAIRVAGMGSAQPLVQCPGARPMPEVVACLQPNRRVEIEVLAE